MGLNEWLAWNWSAPLARLRVSASHVVIRMPLHEVSLDRSAIETIREVKGLVSRGVRIVHSAPKTSPFLVFWTRDPVGVLRALSERGFPTEGRGA